MTGFPVIVADPPWRYRDGGGWTLDQDGRRTVHKLPYPQMTVAEIAALPVQTVALPDTVLYLWATNRYLHDAYHVCEAWGFRPSTTVVWAKVPRGVGMGTGPFAITTEFVLFARRGHPPAPLVQHPSSWWQWSRGEHSAKPDAFLDLVEQAHTGPYLELFARRQRLGWETWGDQAIEHVAL